MTWSEEALITQAVSRITDEGPVLVAGIFGLANLIAGSTAGTAAGGVAGDTAAGAADALGVGGMFGALLKIGGALAGMRAGTHATASAQGASVRLLVAITAERIHVLNTGDADQQTEFDAFDRSSVQIDTTTVGASRFLTLTDPETGHTLRLHGTLMPLSPLAEGDAAVFALLEDAGDEERSAPAN